MASTHETSADEPRSRPRRRQARPPSPKEAVQASGDHSAAIGGDATNAIIVTGDHSRVVVGGHTTRGRLVAAAVALVGLASAAVTLYQFSQQAFAPTPRMTGAYNIAIAEFTAPTSGSAAQRAASLAIQTASGLQQSLNNNPGSVSVQVWDPGRTHRVTGANPTERARAAQTLAHQIDADVIVYGSVQADAAATTLSPEFYLSDTKLQGAEELAGQYELGSPIVSEGDFERNPATFDDLSEGLQRRSQALTQFVFGLGQFARRDFVRAKQTFVAADTPAWADADGKELLYLFLGTTSGMQGDLSDARAQYEHALRLRPGFARALLGLAEVEFQAAGPSQDCAPGGVDAELLRKAAADLDAVEAAPVQPAISNIGVKTRYLRGRVDLCASQAELDDRWDAARGELQSVVDAFGSGNAAMQDYAAEAHAALGLMAFPLSDEADARVRADAYQQAVQEYEQARRLSLHRERQAEFSTMLGYLHARLGEPAPAATAYASASELDPQNRGRYEDLRSRWEATAAPN